MRTLRCCILRFARQATCFSFGSSYQYHSDNLSIAGFEYNEMLGQTSVIVLVDDNAIQVATRKAILEQAGVEVVVASDGLAALDLVSRSGFAEKIGLMVTDHLMPGMNGPELVRVLRKRGFEFPIVVLSGLPDAENDYEELGVTFRSKPFRPDSLIALARELLGSQMRRTA